MASCVRRAFRRASLLPRARARGASPRSRTNTEGEEPHARAIAADGPLSFEMSVTAPAGEISVRLLPATPEVSSTHVARERAADPPHTIDELLPERFGAYSWLVTLSCGVCYGLGGIAVGLPNFLGQRLHDEGWSISKFDQALVSSLFFTGNLGGLLFWGAACDRYGRLVGVRCGILLMACAVAATFLAPSTPWLLAARVLTGFANGGVMNSSFVLLAELTAPQHRILAKSLQESFFAMGLLWLSLSAYLVRHAPWQALSLAFLPLVLAACAAAFLPESPRYLLAAGDADGATSVLAVIARRSGFTLPPDVRLCAPSGSAASPSRRSEDASPPAARVAGAGDGVGGAVAPSASSGAAAGVGAAIGGMCGAFAQLWHRSLRVRTALVGGAWLGSTAVYNGVLLQPVSLSSSIYSQQALGALVELPSYVVLYLLGDSLGRRRTWLLLLAISGTPLLLLSTLPPAAPSALTLSTYLLGRLGAAGGKRRAPLTTPAPRQPAR